MRPDKVYVSDGAGRGGCRAIAGDGGPCHYEAVIQDGCLRFCVAHARIRMAWLDAWQRYQPEDNRIRLPLPPGAPFSTPLAEIKMVSPKVGNYMRKL